MERGCREAERAARLWCRIPQNLRPRTDRSASHHRRDRCVRRNAFHARKPFRPLPEGDIGAISASEKRGYALFKENGCASCHVGQSLGGQGMEIMGLAGDYVAARDGKATDADLGRYTVTHAEQDRARFKVPNLRNIALTGPYMHDGSAKTLPEAVRLMVRFQTPKGDCRTRTSTISSPS
jgi:cytochrome c peroxidase